MKSKKIGNGRWVLGDCLEAMSKIPDNSIDMVLCDLPYGTTACKWDSIIPIDSLWKQYDRMCKGTIVLTAAQPFTSYLIMSNIKDFKYDWIWEKTQASGHLNAKKMPMRAHEHILIFKKPLVYNPIKTHGHVKKEAVRRNNTDVYGSQSAETAYSSTSRYPRSIQVFPKDVQKTAIHPTQKPVALFEYLIKTYTNPGMVVLDNCAGSGTTAIACENTKRHWICIEKDKGYTIKACQRIREHLKGNA